MICIPKIIYFNNLNTNKFWDNTILYNYITSHISYIDETHQINNSKYHYIESGVSAKWQFNFDIYTKIYKKSKLLSFFTYKKISHINITDINIVQNAQQNQKEDILYTNINNELDQSIDISYNDLTMNPISLLDIILNINILVYNGKLVYRI